MSRRLVLTVITGGLLAGGLSATALADTSAAAARHNLCVGDPTTNTGWCVVVDDPATTLSRILPPH